MTPTLPTRQDLWAVLVAYDSAEDLRRSIQALSSQSVLPRCLIVIDNSPVALPVPSDCVFPTDVIHRPDNPGPSGGFQAGFRRALEMGAEPSDLLLLLDDNDPLPESTVVSELLRAVERLRTGGETFGGVGMRGAVLDRRRGRTLSPTKTPPFTRVDHLHGGFAPIYSLAAVEAVDGFREELFFGFEELDIGLRISQAGFQLWQDDGASRHIPDSYADRSRLPGVLSRQMPAPRRYYSMRNLIDILRRNGAPLAALKIAIGRGLLLPLIALPLSPRRAWAHWALNTRAIHDGFRSRLGRRMAVR